MDKETKLRDIVTKNRLRTRDVKKLVKAAIKKEMGKSDYNAMVHAYMYLTDNGKGMFSDTAEELLSVLISKLFLQ